MPELVWFILPIWNWIWTQNYPWIYATLFVVLAIFLYIAWILLGKSKWSDLVKKVRAIGSQLKRKKGIRLPWGRWITSFVLISIVGFVVWTGCISYRLWYVASHLSWQANEFIRANCAGMRAAHMTGQKIANVQNWMPTYGQYSERLQPTMLIVGHHELVQKGIIEDIPIAATQDWEKFQKADFPENIIPTPFGKTFCTYLLDHPPTKKK